MKILVLGGNGFIGSHIVDQLMISGHEVRVFDRSPDPWRKPLAGVGYFFADFSNTPVLAEALQGVDAVVHAISTTVPSTSNLDPVADIQSNLENSVRLMQLMVAAHVERLIYISSGGTVYGIPQQLPVPESHPLDPICSYGIVKLAIEKYMGMYAHLYGIKPLILRASNPYGPRQGHRGVQGAIATFMQKIMKKEKITIWGDGLIRRDYLYVTDLAELCCKAIGVEEVGVFNVGSGMGSTLNELILVIEQVVGAKADIEYVHERKFDVKEIVLDIKKSQRVFGWNPEINIDQGIKLQYVWMLDLLYSSCSQS